MEEIVLRCENNLEGILTAIYEAFVYKKNLDVPYEDQISIQIGEGGNLRLFATDVMVETDARKADKTVYAIQTKLGFSIYQTVFYALCHFDEDRATAVLGYLVRAFSKGSRIREYMADPYVMRVLELSRKASNECQKMMGFLRFREMGGFLYAKIEPKCDDIPLMQEHFADRYPNENFVIYDAVRDYVLIHPAYRRCFYASKEAVGDALSRLSDSPLGEAVSEVDEYEGLWKRYFQTMGIDARENERCQNTLLPKWYRKNMLEF